MLRRGFGNHVHGALKALHRVGVKLHVDLSLRLFRQRQRFAPMTKQTPIQIYYQLCVRLRERIEFAESVANSSAPDWQIAETVSIQGRKAIETIAHMCIVATEHGLGELGIPQNVKKQWNAEIIFKGLKSKNIKVVLCRYA